MENFGNEKKWKFWIDRGGTFTDVVCIDPEENLNVQKVLSQSPHYKNAVIEGIKKAMGEGYDPSLIGEIRLGTTVATNAFLEKKGVPCALATTLGFRDSLLIRKQNRPRIFDLNIQKIAPLYQEVSEVYERLDANGKVVIALDEEIARHELTRLKDKGVESLSVALLHSTINPAHELRLEQIAKEVGFQYVSLSHRVSPLPKFIARAETSVIDAYLTPLLGQYTQYLQGELKNKIYFMQSHGGLCAGSELKGHNALLSGPAGGLVGAAKTCSKRGLDKIIAFDMGGTSTDVAIYDGAFALNSEPEFLGLGLQTPMLDIHTVAAGGGSILNFDGERFKVGPESAGAFPGPACYRNGGPLTVTDANLFLGRIDALKFPKIFGPEQNESLDEEIVKEKFEELAKKIGLSAKEVALGFLRVAVETMGRAIKKVSVEKGHDPKDFSLCVFGGAGAQVACQVADSLQMKKIFIHPLSSVLSAFGMGLAEEKKRVSKAFARDLSKTKDEVLQASLKQLYQEAKDSLGAGENFKSETFFHMRIKGSDHTIEAPANSIAQAKEIFNRRHLSVFGMEPSGEIELTGLSLEMWKPREEVAKKEYFQSSEEVREGPSVISGNNTSLAIEEGWMAKKNSFGEWLLEKKPGHATSFSQPKGAELEIFYQRFQAVAEEMGRTLQHTGHSVNIKERLDFSCAIFNPQGELIANAPHIPVHLGSMSSCAQYILNKFKGDIHPGDAFIVNDPQQGGTHLPDITVVSPVFWEEEIIFYVASRGHHSDVGGIAPGSMPGHSKNLQEEGIVIPATKFVERNELDEQKLEKMFLSGKWPARNFHQNLHDLKAQLAANIKGIEGLLELGRLQGPEKLAQISEDILGYSNRRIKEVLKDFKEGRALLKLEGKRELALKVVNSPQKIVFDFGGTSKASLENFNAPMSVVRSAILYSLRCLIEEDIPLNDGLIRDMELKAPEGCLVNPPPDAAVVAGNVETSQVLCDLALECFGALAHSQGTMNNLSFGNEKYQYYETIAGGAGAGEGFDGANAVQVHMTNSRLTDPEVLESRMPVRLELFALRHGSGGLGNWRGGDGVYRRLLFLEEVDVNILSQRRESAPSGIQGGESAYAGKNFLERQGKPRELMPASFGARVKAGDRLSIETPGGGGFGERQKRLQNLMFAYGSNLDPLQIVTRCPGAKLVTRAVLKEHELSFALYSPRRQGGVADIRPNQGAEVYGIIYELDNRNLHIMDEIEGHPGHYNRIKRQFVDDKGQSWDVWIYDVNDKKPLVKPTKSYRWLVFKGAYNINAPQSYLQKILNVPLSD